MTSNDRPVRIFVVEDHPVMRTMLSEFIERNPRWSVVGSADSAEQALELLPQEEVDLILIDVSLPRMSGIELVGEIGRMERPLRCLIVSGHNEPSYVVNALEAGACGYVLKGRPQDLHQAVAMCSDGGTYVSPPLEERMRKMDRRME